MKEGRKEKKEREREQLSVQATWLAFSSPCIYTLHHKNKQTTKSNDIEDVSYTIVNKIEPLPSNFLSRNVFFFRHF